MVNKELPKDERDIYFEDLEIGKTFITNFSEPISEEQIKLYRQSTGDINPVHSDSTFAQQFGYRDKLVPGYFLLSLGAALTHRSIRAVVIKGISDARFLRPVYFGETVYAKNVVEKKIDRDAKTGKVSLHRGIMNSRDELCVEYRVNFLIQKRCTYESR